MKAILYCLSCLLAVSLIACGTDTSPNQNTSSTSAPLAPVPNDVEVSVGGITQDPQATPGVTSQPSFTLRLTDAPLDGVTRVVITLVSVEMLHQDPTKSVLYTFNTPKTIDLLSLRGTRTEILLADIDIPAGLYPELRLVVDDSDLMSFIELDDGSVHDLKIPSGSSSGLKVKGDINVQANRNVSYTIDFDVRKSVVMAGASGRYLLKPVLRLIDDTLSGHILGTVDPLLLTAPDCSDNDPETFSAAYVFAGHDVIPSDIDTSSSNDVEPVTTATIALDPASGDYVFEAAFLPAGDYTISFTCNTDREDPEAADDLLFFNTQNVTVQINNILFL